MHNSTVSTVICKTQTTVKAKGSGRKKGLVDKPKAAKVAYVKRNPAATERELAQKYGTSKSWIHKVLRSNGLNSYRVQKHANRNDVQHRAKKRSRKLYDSLLRGKNQCIIMDDESYCVSDFSQLPDGLSNAQLDDLVLLDASNISVCQNFLPNGWLGRQSAVAVKNVYR